jgi:citrate synthase
LWFVQTVRAKEVQISVNDENRWLTADEVAVRLNVKRETVYAYVSRGRLPSRHSPNGRGSVFDPAAVERLAARARLGHKPGSASIETELSLIEEGELYYRGIPARKLAEESTVEDAAELLWGSDQARGHPWASDPTMERMGKRLLKVLPDAALPIDKLGLVASGIDAVEPPNRDANPDVVAASARRLLMTMVSALPAHSEPVVGLRDDRPNDLVSTFWSRLCAREPTEAELNALSATMILSLDHDLASSTHLVRSAARAGVGPAGIVRLGADVGSGPVKGATDLAIEDFLRNVESPSTVAVALTKRLRQGEPIPGFGHVMYPDGDSRASQILEHVRACARAPERLATVEEVIRTQSRRGLPPPNAGFAIAALTYVADMIHGAGEAIFVTSRSVGWIAHAIEEYGRPPLPRQRSVYVGPRPGAE